MPPKADDTIPPTPPTCRSHRPGRRVGCHGRYLCALAKLDYEARVRVLAWLARRFDVDTDALRF